MIRMGIIGCGGMAEAHQQAFLGNDQVRVTATVDTDSERAQAAAEMFSHARAATDYSTVIDDVDAAILVLPHHLHHPVGIDCLEAGCHVLLEKPMALSEPACTDLLETAREYGRTLMIAYIQRFNPIVEEVKRLLDAEAYGEPFQVSIWTEQLTRYGEGHWALDAEKLGGGQLFSHGCHYIDLLLWFLGEPTEGTHTGTNRGTPWMEREGTSQVNLKFENGALGYHFGTWGARASRLNYRIHAHCTDGLLDADLTAGTLWGLDPAGHEEQLLDAPPGKHVERQLDHFITCIETGETPRTDPKSSIQSLRVIWRLYEAEAEGRVADLSGCGLEE